MKQISDDQVSRAARNIISQHAEVVRQLNTTMSGSTEEFSSTADEMREAAASVVREIEFARGEVRRAVLELPAETRNSADAMRRVVTDQITALNALADVVKRQSSSLAMSGPGIYVPPDAGGRSPGKTKGTASIAASQRTSGARKTERSVEASEDTSAPAEETGSVRRFLGDLLSSDADTPVAREKPSRKSKKTARHHLTARPAVPRKHLSPS